MKAERIKNPSNYLTRLQRRSKLVKGEFQDQFEWMILCPGCKLKHWWGKDKKHHCIECGLYVMATGSHHWTGSLMGLGHHVPHLVVSTDKKDNLRDKDLLKKGRWLKHRGING